MVVADDDARFRRAAVASLTADEQLDVVAELEDGSEVVHALEEHGADVLVMDYGMRGSGPDLIRRAHRARPTVRVVVVTGQDDARTILIAVRAGARGVISKFGLDIDLGRCVERCALGDVVLIGRGPASVLDLLLENECRHDRADPP